MAYLLLDLDNTIWTKQQLDSKSYEIVSEEVFGRVISMLSHPVTGENDNEFAKHSNHDIWRYKIGQVLDSGEGLTLHGKPITNVSDVDIDELVTRLGPAAISYLRGVSDLAEVVQLYLTPDKLRLLSQDTTSIGVASSGARALQDHLLSVLGYYGAGLDQRLCVFSDEGKDKQILIVKSLEKYREVHQNRPQILVYVGDSEGDMAAIKALMSLGSSVIDFKAVGVQTSMASEQELRASGADLVLPTLNNPQNLKRLEEFLRGLKNGK